MDKETVETENVFMWSMNLSGANDAQCFRAWLITELRSGTRRGSAWIDMTKLRAQPLTRAVDSVAKVKPPQPTFASGHRRFSLSTLVQW